MTNPSESRLGDVRAHLLRRMPPFLRQHPDLALLGLLLVIGGAIRLAFLFRAPAFFVGGDSQTYLLPAYLLAREGTWDLGPRRPPGYPMFLAGVITLLGEHTRAINFAQHVLGLATVGAAYGLGRAALGRWAGFLAGLGTALSGPLLVYEHYIMSESLFSLAVVAWAWLALVNRSRQSWLLALLVGAVLGIAWLVRPAALILAPALPLALLGAAPLRRIVALTACSLLGYFLATGPWMVYSSSQYGVSSPIGVGNNLIWRTTRYELNRMTKNEPPLISQREPWSQREREAMDPARRYVIDRAVRRDLPDDIADGLVRRFGLTEIQADRLLAEVGLEAIRARPELFLRTTVIQALDVFIGTEQNLGGQGKEGGVTRFADPETKYESWWDERIRHIPESPLPTEAAEFGRARGLVGLFQPHRYTPGLLLLLGVAIVYGLVSPAHRQSLFLGAVIVGGLLGAAAVSGSAPRFRYPLDPLIWVMACIGVAAVVNGLRALGRLLAVPRRSPLPSS